MGIKILDLSAGNRAIWWDKNHPLATFLDKRAEVEPTYVCDTREIPAEVGADYDLFVFDPPHANFGQTVTWPSAMVTPPLKRS